MAMYVVLENYLGMICDTPQAYAGQDGFDFICTVPTTWDEIKVLEASLNEYVVIARRKGSDWYVGGITNHVPRNITVSLDFLGNGGYDLTVWNDVKETEGEATNLDIRKGTASRADSVTLFMAGDGGAVARFEAK